MAFQINYEIVKVIPIASEKGKDLGEQMKELGLDCPYPIPTPVRKLEF